jgi:hypothetical protein
MTMQYQKRSIIFLFFLCLACTSCIKNLETDIPVSSKLCFNCILNPDSLISGSLSLSQSISEVKTFKKVNNASIELKKDGQVIGNMKNTGEGIYSLDLKPSSGSFYEISVNTEGFKPLYASTKVPEKPSVSYQKGEAELQVISSAYSYYTYPAIFTIHDKPGINRYWKYGKNLLNGIWRFMGGHYDVDAPFFDDFNKVTEATYKYGYYYAYYLRINDTGHDGETLTFSETYFLTGYDVLFFLDVDEHYDKYMKSTIKQMMNDGDNLLFNEPVQIYTNIKNGYGIFGSAAIISFKL